MWNAGNFAGHDPFANLHTNNEHEYGPPGMAALRSFNIHRCLAEISGSDRPTTSIQSLASHISSEPDAQIAQRELGHSELEQSQQQLAQSHLNQQRGKALFTIGHRLRLPNDLYVQNTAIAPLTINPAILRMPIKAVSTSTPRPKRTAKTKASISDKPKRVIKKMRAKKTTPLVDPKTVTSPSTVSDSPLLITEPTSRHSSPIIVTNYAFYDSGYSGYNNSPAF